MMSASLQTSESELCCICFDQVCTIEVQACGHQMCAHCILSLCCHNKPDPTTLCVPAPLCPFCRSDIARLVVVKTKTLDDGGADTPSRSRRSRRSRNLSEGSNSFKGLSTLGSFTKMTGRGSGLKADSSDTTDKPWKFLPLEYVIVLWPDHVELHNKEIKIKFLCFDLYLHCKLHKQCEWQIIW